MSWLCIWNCWMAAVSMWARYRIGQARQSGEKSMASWCLPPEALLTDRCCTSDGRWNQIGDDRAARRDTRRSSGPSVSSHCSRTNRAVVTEITIACDP